MSLRPGSQTALDLVKKSTKDSDYREWEDFLLMYKEVLEHYARSKSSRKEKTSKSSESSTKKRKISEISVISEPCIDMDLAELDSILFSKDFLKKVSQRDVPYLTQAELSCIMKWKLSRGKFRPLQALCDSNGDKAVIETTKLALQEIDISSGCEETDSTSAIRVPTLSKWEKSMNILCRLKGMLF